MELLDTLNGAQLPTDDGSHTYICWFSINGVPHHPENNIPGNGFLSWHSIFKPGGRTKLLPGETARYVLSSSLGLPQV